MRMLLVFLLIYCNLIICNIIENNDNRLLNNSNMFNFSKNSVYSFYNSSVNNITIDNFVDNSVNNSVNNFENNTVNNFVNTVNNSVNNFVDNSVNNSVNNFVNNSVNNSVNNFVDNSANNSVNNFVNNTVNDSVNNFVNNTVNNSVNNTVNNVSIDNYSFIISNYTMYNNNTYTDYSISNFSSMVNNSNIDNILGNYSKSNMYNSSTFINSNIVNTANNLTHMFPNRTFIKPKMALFAISADSTCSYVQIKSGQSAYDACDGKVSESDLKNYNPNTDFTKLSVGQYICCSSGSLPNFQPSKNSDGTCYTYKVVAGDTCSAISAKYYPLSIQNIENYNKNNFGWKGCNNLQLDYNLCISEGYPPKPTPNPKAECGPLAPGDKYMSECPLNACCSEFGFCGLTSEFCDKRSSDTGSPGTDGCYSNCGYGNLHTDVRSDFDNIVYWMDTEGELSYDPSLLNNIYSIVHYAFVNINDDFSIDYSKILNSDFNSITSKKVASFGGWDFSTNPSTYHIFRNGVNTENRGRLVDNIVKFAIELGLDGIDLDWEYPGAPDIPGIPADDPNNGKNYLEFVKLLRSKLPSDKTLSMAIPSSYWYLKNFPIKDIQNYLDYMVYMTYDIFGTWDLQKDNSIKCHTNQTSIVEALKMLDKAGVQIGKTYGGIANYGRSYKASSQTCLKENCPFSGPGNSRSMTNTPGVLSDSEIIDINGSPAKNDRWTDSVSDCIFMRYDGDSIVSWPRNRGDTTNFFHNHGLKGSVLWAANYYKHDAFIETDNIDCDLINLYDDNKMDFECINNNDLNKRNIDSNTDLADIFKDIALYTDANVLDYMEEFSISIYVQVRNIFKKYEIKGEFVDSIEHMYYFWTKLIKNYLELIKKENIDSDTKKSIDDYKNMLILTAPTFKNILDGSLEQSAYYLSQYIYDIDFDWGDVGRKDKIRKDEQTHREWLRRIIGEQDSRNNFYIQMLNILTLAEIGYSEDNKSEYIKRSMDDRIIIGGFKLSHTSDFLKLILNNISHLNRNNFIISKMTSDYFLIVKGTLTPDLTLVRDGDFINILFDGTSIKTGVVVASQINVIVCAKLSDKLMEQQSNKNTNSDTCTEGPVYYLNGNTLDSWCNYDERCVEILKHIVITDKDEIKQKLNKIKYINDNLEKEERIPVHIFNALNLSKEAACTAVRHLITNIINNINCFNNKLQMLDVFNHELTNYNPDYYIDYSDYYFYLKLRYSATRNEAFSRSTSSPSYLKCCNQDRDEFPYASTRDGGNLQLSNSGDSNIFSQVLCINSDQNSLDGQIYGKFTLASRYSKDNMGTIIFNKIYPLYQNSFVSYSIGDNDDRIRLNDGDPFYILINAIDIDCANTHEPLNNYDSPIYPFNFY